MIPITRRRFIATSALAAASAAAVASPSLAFADELADKQAEASAVASQLSDWQAQLNTASDNYYQALEAHDAAVELMNQAQATIDDDESQITTLQDHLSTRARGMYRSGTNSFLEVLLSAESFTDFVTTWDTLNSMNQDDEASVSQVKELKAEAEAAKQTYSEQEQVAQQKLDEAAQIKDEAEATVSQYQAKVSSLDTEVAALVEAQRQAEAAKATQATSEAAFAAELANAANNSTDSGSASTGNTDSGSTDGGSADSGSTDSGSTDSGSSGGSRPVGDYGSVLDAAASRVGCAYVWGAEGPDCFDCSGLVVWSYAQVGYGGLPHYSGSLGFIGNTYAVSDAQPGDILWMSGHVGIYAGGGSSVEAMDEDHGVCYGNAWRFDHATHP